MKPYKSREPFLINRHFRDLNPLSLGDECCEPRHRFGPFVRNYVLIHYVLSGKGTFSKGGKTYSIGEGEAFLILPGEITVYEADAEDPWHYQWVGFDGELSVKFFDLPAVLRFSENWIQTMIASVENPFGEYLVASVLFRMVNDLLSERSETGNRYVRQIKNHIRTHYMEKISVERLAESMNLDRRYLSRLFKAETGLTVQDYLIDVRMEEAKKQLERGASVNDAATLCGYEDVCNFSKMFRKKNQCSPGRWGRAGK